MTRDAAAIEHPNDTCIPPCTLQTLGTGFAPAHKPQAQQPQDDPGLVSGTPPASPSPPEGIVPTPIVVPPPSFVPPVQPPYAAPVSGADKSSDAPASTPPPVLLPQTPLVPPSTPLVPPLSPPAPQGFVSPPAPLEQGAVAAVWQPLVQRLAADGVYGPEVDALFAAMPPVISQAPMGRKIQELYKSKFTPRQPAPSRPKEEVYSDVIIPGNVTLCRQFMREHAGVLQRAWLRSGVSPQVVVALLFVETRLGTFLGKADALYTLASMAVSTSPEAIPDWLAKLPADHTTHLDWMREIMPRRADWAYKELKALVTFTVANKLPANMPGSIYGAIGLCQFMPSNLLPYGADGDGDGKINLFVPADAIMSLTNYLYQHGWRRGIPRIRQHVLLKKYNNSNAYARTILMLADSIMRAELGRNLKKGKTLK